MPQPSVGGPFRGRNGHAGHDGGKSAASLAAIEAELVEQSWQSERRQGFEAGMFDADRAAGAVVGGIDIDGLEVLLARWTIFFALLVSFDQLGGDSLGFGLDSWIRVFERQKGTLIGEGLFDALAQDWPVLALNGEVPTEVKERDLSDFIAFSSAFDEAEGDALASVTCGPGFCLPYEHVDEIVRRLVQCNPYNSKAGTVSETPRLKPNKIRVLESEITDFGQK